MGGIYSWQPWQQGPWQPWKECFQGHMWSIMMNHQELSWRVIMIHGGESSWFIIMMHHDDASSWYVMMIHHERITMVRHDESPFCIMMMHYDESSWWIMMIHHDDESRGPERIPSGLPWHFLPWAPWINATHLFMAPMAFFQAETLKMGIATAKGRQKK